MVWILNCKGFYLVEKSSCEFGEYLALVTMENELVVLDLV